MVRVPKLAWAAVAVVTGHILWLAMWPNADWSEIVSEQFQLMAGLLAGFACWQAGERSHHFAKTFWRFSAVTFAIWSIGSLLGSIHDAIPHATPDPPLSIVLIVFLSTAPMFVAALMGGGEPETEVRWDVILDVAQLLILVIAIHIMLVAIPSLTFGQRRAAINRLLLLASWRGALAIALVVRAIFSRSPIIRHLLAPVAGAMSLFALGSALGNYIDRFNLWSKVQWFELAWTIPFAMVAVSATVWREPAKAPPVEKASAGMAPGFVIYLPSLAIPILLLSLYQNIVFEQILVGLCAMIISIICFTLRVLVAQRRQKQTLEELRRSERRYRSLFENNMAAVYRSTLDGRILDCNQAFCDMFGYTQEEILHASADVLYIGGHSERDSTVSKVRGQQAQRSVEGKYRRKDGTLIHTLGHRAISFDENGNELLEGTLIDMSQRRLLEAQLQQAQKMESLGMMAGGIAHDFNNMLTVITGYSAMQMDRIPHGDPLREYSAEIKAAADRAAALTRQLLAFSRQQVMEEKVVNLNSLIRDFEKFLRRLIGEDVEVRTAFDKELGAVRVDPGQIEQVLMNLVVNARDAMPSGGTISIQTANAYLDSGYLERQPMVTAGPYVKLSVRDTGTGMTEETIGHIFEPFFTTKAVGKGTGLGLATTYGIVKQSRGYIDVSSAVGEGSRFDVYLPQLAKRAFDEDEEKSVAVPRGDEGILLVEDNHALRSMAKTLLESYGYTVFAIADPGEVDSACDLHSDRIELLLTDIVLPRMSGTEVARRVAEKIPGVRILYMSGFPTHAMFDRKSLEGTGSFLQKPFAPATLASKVREVLDNPVSGNA